MLGSFSWWPTTEGKDAEDADGEGSGGGRERDSGMEDSESKFDVPRKNWRKVWTTRGTVRMAWDKKRTDGKYAGKVVETNGKRRARRVAICAYNESEKMLESRYRSNEPLESEITRIVMYALSMVDNNTYPLER